MRKAEYRVWQRKMRISSGQARLNRALESLDVAASAAQ